jgi:formylglycine-generating enzyme required for sulfatase activity
MKPKPIVFPNPAQATPQQPWENSLGMKFVPVPGTRVLFSIYETRRRDAEPFLTAVKEHYDVPWIASDAALHAEAAKNSFVNFRTDSGEWTNITYDEPGWPITPDHPAFLFSGRDAHLYCLWLTWKEQREGRLKNGQRYRLPTTAEWLLACGGDAAKLRPANLAGPEAREGKWPRTMPTLEERDPFPRTAPVGSFAAELHGLYDVSGNVAEWVNDDSSIEVIQRFQARSHLSLRGPAYTYGRAEQLSFGFTRPAPPLARVPFAGFRVVLEWRE